MTNSGTISGTIYPNLTLPVVQSLPPFDTVQVGTKDTTFANGVVGTLPPGRYRDVTLSPQAVITLTSGGKYDFRTLYLKSGSSLLFTGPTHVRVANGFSQNNGAYFGPVKGSPLGAADIIVYIIGKDSQSPFTKSAAIGPQALTFANVYAPNGTVWLEDLTQATGAFLGKDVLVGKKVQIALATGFSGLAKQDRTEVETPAANVPLTFALEQNYPNPFNPSTTIRYQLPQDREVSLVVYDILGQVVKTLVRGQQKAGAYSVQWDATNDAGFRVSSGMYIYRITAGTFTESRKMVLLK